MKLEMQRFSVQIGVFELKEFLTPSTAMSYKRNEVMYIEIYLAIYIKLSTRVLFSGIQSNRAASYIYFNLTSTHLYVTNHCSLKTH